MSCVKNAQKIKENLVLLILLIRSLWLKFIVEVDDNWNDLLMSSCSCIGNEFKFFVKTGSLRNVFLQMVFWEIFSTKSFKSCFVNIWSFNSKWTLSFKLRLLAIWPLIFLVPLWSVFVFLNHPSNGKQSDKCKGPCVTTWSGKCCKQCKLNVWFFFPYNDSKSLRNSSIRTRENSISLGEISSWLKIRRNKTYFKRWWK